MNEAEEVSNTTQDHHLGDWEVATYRDYGSQSHSVGVDGVNTSGSAL